MNLCLTNPAKNSPAAALQLLRVKEDGHTMFCDECSSGSEPDDDGDMHYDCHCGGGYFPGEC